MKILGTTGHSRAYRIQFSLRRFLLLLVICIFAAKSIEYSYTSFLSFPSDEIPINCTVGRPCEYEDVVDFRVMLITYDRHESLSKCLSFLEKIDTMGDTMRIEIWIDRSVKGVVNNETVKVSEEFKQRWNNKKQGKSCAVHIREKNAGITGQWTDTWRPQVGSKEIGLIVEDDIDVAPTVYRWLKAAHAKYDHRNDVSGYSLQSTNVNFFLPERRKPMFGPKTDTVFMHSVLGTWGFSPHPRSWREFQDWAHDVRDNDKVKPYVPDVVLTKWYKTFESNNRQSSMWEMWHIYYSYVKNMYCVYCNLKAHTGKENVLLSWNRKEHGLHFKGKSIASTNNLLSDWEDSFVSFPERTIQFAYNGTIHKLV
ncbi:hypothetical protein CAPTEDRAFT_197326 [Capitella teleta]|uniref:Glycosyl transferase 64 domain-containing protein n=1 Tax=Capitella teleta TaxID=283909 RepID=R7TQ08_CAPTE|nr:hypothetical protein CAPTEDRAFT_197326 [Capitella teleta]|eukprot:ELT95652.1 hypothetical protein CAPTEDRAFT_197326 [Capitella teleta]